MLPICWEASSSPHTAQPVGRPRTAAADALTVFCNRNAYDCCKLHGDLKVKGSVVRPAGDTPDG